MDNYQIHENDGLKQFQKHMALRKRPEGPPEEKHNGKAWWDMPGISTDAKLINFSLYRWGLLEPDKEKSNSERD
jgi:hypothetical protein